MQLYISREGQQFGPYSIEQARDYMASGNLLAEDLAWHDGAAEWVPLAQVPGVVPAARAGAAPRDWIPPLRSATSSAPKATASGVVRNVPVREAVIEPVQQAAPSLSGDDKPTLQRPSPEMKASPRKQRGGGRSFGRSRPLSVSIIGWILCVLGACSVLGTLQALFLSDDPRMQKAIASSPVPFSVQVGFMAVIAVVTLVVGISFLRGANWARWLYIGFCVVCLVFGLICNPNKIMIIPPVMLQGVIIFFLFRPKASDYFLGD